MDVATLVDGLGARVEQGDPGAAVRDVTEDSREVVPGSLFIARRGAAADGMRFLDDALQRGAGAVLTEPTDRPPALVEPSEVVWLTMSPLTPAVCSEVAGHFFGRPSRQLGLIGVTGTNGKTTTAWLIHHLLQAGGVRAGLMGTIAVDTGGARFEPELTTPGAVTFVRRLARMVEAGCEAAVCEVSSHALEQGRVASLRFEAGVFTNLTGDHLDYHGTMAAYAAAKGRLFEQLPPEGWAVINGEDDYAKQMAEATAAQVVPTTVAEPSADDRRASNGWRGAKPARARLDRLTADRSMATFDGPWGRFSASLPLVGRHNVANALQAATATHLVSGASAEALSAGLAASPAVPGRLEPVRPKAVNGNGHEAGARPAVLVDYAHTHDALDNVLSALGPVTQGALVVVFGCGGDRDTSKRPKMAQVAANWADRLYVTSDNPRTEDPKAIIGDIVAGLNARDRRRTTVEPDRAAAIAEAIKAAGPSDTVLIAGKGHEDYQIVGREKRHFDDREQALSAVSD